VRRDGKVEGWEVEDNDVGKLADRLVEGRVRRDEG
jgi:hypothetical protein